MCYAPSWLCICLCMRQFRFGWIHLACQSQWMQHFSLAEKRRARGREGRDTFVDTFIFTLWLHIARSWAESHHSPGADLLLCVFNPWDRFAAAETESKQMLWYNCGFNLTEWFSCICLTADWDSIKTQLNQNTVGRAKLSEWLLL